MKLKLLLVILLLLIVNTPIHSSNRNTDLLLPPSNSDGYKFTVGDFTFESNNYSLGSSESVAIHRYNSNRSNPEIPTTVTFAGYTFPVTAIYSEAFKKATFSKKLIIPENFYVASNAFEEAYVYELEISNGVRLASNSFRNCSRLQRVNFLDNDIIFHEYTFYACYSINKVQVLSRIPVDLSAISVPFYINLSGFTLYVPKGTKAVYENAIVWRDFGTIIEVEEDIESTEIGVGFEELMLELGYDTDGELNGKFVPIADVANVKTLDFSDKGIKSLEGIEHFTGLETLVANKNTIEVADLRANTNLKSINLEYNNLETLYFRDNIYLEELYLRGNNLTGVELDNTPNLKILELTYNKIKTLDVRPVPQIEYVGVKENGTLEEILLEDNIGLKYLFAGFNILEGIDLAEAPNLVSLELNDNLLSGIIDLSTHMQMTSYNLCNNGLDAYPGGECKGGYPAALPALIQFTSLEAYMVYKGWDLDGSTNGNIVSNSSVNLMKTLDISGLGIQDVSGIELFTSLEQLFASGNEISSIDLSNNTLLKDLNIKGNQLTMLDLSSNTNLEYVEAQGNQLTSINLGAQNFLKTLFVAANKLSSLDVSQVINLEELDASVNELSTIDLTSNTSLYKLKLNNNLLITVNIKNGNNKLISNADFNTSNNENLDCVIVDDVVFSTFTWTSYVDDVSVFTSNTNCSKPATVEDDIEIVNGTIVVPDDVVDLKIFTQSGRVVDNLNLAGIYYVQMIDYDGNVYVRKILVN